MVFDYDYNDDDDDNCFLNNLKHLCHDDDCDDDYHTCSFVFDYGLKMKSIKLILIQKKKKRIFLIKAK